MADLPGEPPLPGFKMPRSDTERAIALLQTQRWIRRGANLPLPQGGLFDEVARREQDLF